ncbi:MAG: glucose 1-dehydrogenase [Rubrivivax sp.]|nr:glucose 1-dehydrogenase [Rubrivivax sp.]
MIDASTFRLDGRLTLVTGSSTGIGLALARGLAQAGAAVVLNGRDRDKLARAAAALRAEGHRVHERAFNATDAPAVESAVTSIEAEIGPIDILVNNAGITRRAPFTELPLADWQDVMRTNVEGLFIVGQAVARRMVSRRRGRIVNICSVMSEMARPGTSAYTASKGAAKMLTKAMATELGPQGINVNAIGPGYFATELTAPLVADEQFSAWVARRAPVGRWGRVEELAPVAVFLASDASSFINGHVLYADGGMTATL